MNVLGVDHDVAEIDPDAKLDPLRLCNIRVALGHAALHVHRAAHGVHHARKLDKDAVSGGLDDAPTVLRNLRVHQFATAGLQACESAFLVSSHESAIASHIGGQDGGELAFDPLGRHRGALS